ncbi:MAG: hypothetical protein ACMUIA_10730 [bacterium]
MTRDTIRTIIISFIFCFICSGFMVSHTYCSEDNPYCTGDQERIQELTDEFIQKYGDEVKIRWNETTGIPTRIYGIYPNPSDVDLENPKKTAISFLSENSLFFGIDHIDDLKFQEVDELSTQTGYKVDYDIFYQGVPLVGSGNVRVIMTEMSDGRIRLTLLSDYSPCIDLDVDPTITAAEAANVVKKDLGVSRLVLAKRTSAYSSSGTGNYPYGFPYGFYANLFHNYPSPYPSTYNSPSVPSPYSYSSRYIEEPVEPELIIYEKDGEVYLAWKFLCSKEPYGAGLGYYYHIDAHTGKIIHAYELKPYAGYGEADTTSSSPVPYNPYTPYNPVYNNPYSTPYSTPYTPYTYNPYSYTPYSTPYTLYNSPISGGQSYYPYGYQQFYNPYDYGWNQPYNYGWNQQPYSYGWNQPYGYNLLNLPFSDFGSDFHVYP